MSSYTVTTPEFVGWEGTDVPLHLLLPSTLYGGQGSSVGIATDYGLDGPGLNPGGDEIFRPS